MKKIYTLASAILISLAAFSQTTSVTVEIYQVHCGPCTDNLLGGSVDLSGYVTYRVYANLPGSSDCLSAVIGGITDDSGDLECMNADDTDQLIVDFEGQVFNHDFGGGMGNQINCALGGAACTLEWDSWITIGADCLANGATIFEAEATDCPGASLACLGNPDPAAGAWFDGCDFMYDNGGWFSPNGLNPVATAGADLKVLIAQFTTNGGFSMNGWIGYQAGCIPGSDVISEQFNIYQPGPEAAPGLAIESVDIVDPCLGLASVTILNSGGSLITYELFDAATDILVNEVSSDQDVTINIPSAGTYYVVADDEMQCAPMQSDDFAVDFPPALSFDAVSAGEILCAGDETAIIETACEGGTPGYNVELHYTGPGEEYFVNAGCGVDFNNLECGSYVLTMTDENGCEEQTSINIACVEPIDFSAGVESDVSCYGECDGMAVGSVDGGVGEITVSLDSGQSVSGNSPFNFDFDDLCGSLYTATAVDENGCSSSTQFVITQPEEMYVELAVILEDEGNGSGSIALTIAGGNPPYSIQWSNGSTSNSINNLDGGSYSATITDENGCSIVVEYSVPVGIGEISADGISLYPNPAHDFVVISSATPLNQVQILDCTGRTIGIESMITMKENLTLDVSRLAQGLYMMLATSSNGTVILEFVKE